jgi:hypothetical protein
MSEWSYRQNVRLGVTGQFRKTCLPACLERISPDHKLSWDIYPLYEEWENDYEKLSDAQAFRATPEKIAIYNKIFKQLGGFTCDDVLFKEIKFSAYHLDAQLQRWMRLGQRVCVGVTAELGNHALGVLPGSDEGTYKLVSNTTPHTLQGNVTAGVIFENLTQPDLFYNISDELKAKNHPINYANAMVLPIAA